MNKDKNKLCVDLEEKIFRIQQSTRTLFKFFIPIHEWCRQKSKLYYNWHLNPAKAAIHWLFLAFFAIVSVLFLVNYGTAKTVSLTPAVVSRDQTLQEDEIERKLDYLIKQTAQISTESVIKEVSRRLATTDQSLENISQQIETSLKSQNVQEAIISQINNELTRSDILSDISQQIGQLPGSSIAIQLAEILAKASTEVTLLELKNQIEKGLDLEKEELSEIKKRIGDLTNPESGSANDLLRKIQSLLTKELSVSITNWIDAIGVTNWPKEFPDPNVSRSQEQIGKDYFGREQSFEVWASRRGYIQTVYSGIIANPTSDTTDLLTLRVPRGHTYYLIDAIYSTKNSTSTIIKVLQRSKNGEFATVVIETGSQSISQKTPIQIKAGDELKWQIVGDREASGGTTLTVYYIDLPWEE